MTDEEIRRLRTLCEAATPGPWQVAEYDGDDWTCDYKIESGSGTVLAGPSIRHAGKVQSNATFIAEARTALPAALDEIERLREILGNVEFYLRNSTIEKICSPVLIEQIKPFRASER